MKVWPGGVLTSFSSRTMLEYSFGNPSEAILAGRDFEKSIVEEFEES